MVWLYWWCMLLCSTSNLLIILIVSVQVYETVNHETNRLDFAFPLLSVLVTVSTYSLVCFELQALWEPRLCCCCWGWLGCWQTLYLEARMDRLCDISSVVRKMISESGDGRAAHFIWQSSRSETILSCSLNNSFVFLLIICAFFFFRCKCWANTR